MVRAPPGNLLTDPWGGVLPSQEPLSQKVPHIMILYSSKSKWKVVYYKF